MAGNAISEMTPGSLPPLVKHLHVGRNHLNSLNHTLRYDRRAFSVGKKEEYYECRESTIQSFIKNDKKLMRAAIYGSNIISIHL